jgi:hypothetical protein
MYGGVIKTFADLKKIAGDAQGFTPATRLLAILFMRKGQEITDKLITPSLIYLHLRSRSNTHFIMPGWVHQKAGRGAKPRLASRLILARHSTIIRWYL